MTCRDRTFESLPSEIKTRLAGRVWAEMRLGPVEAGSEGHRGNRVPGRE
jgi:hypothetical protein